MRTTGLSFSALLVAAGAILAWAVSYEANGVDLQRVGVILFIVGLVLAAVTLIASAASSHTVVERDQRDVVREDGRVATHDHEAVTTTR